MAVQQRLTAAGFSAQMAQAVEGTVANSLVATGTIQGNALALPADINRFGTVAAGTGAIIPPCNGGDELTVVNAGANALLVYPPVGGTINSLAANAGYSVAAATPTCFIICITPTQYSCSQSA